MTHGYASDADGDETIMQDPQATFSVDLSQLPPEQALMLAREAGIEQYDPFEVGVAMQGEKNHLKTAEFHFSLGTALTMLDEVGAINLPEQPPAVPEETIDE